MIIGRGIMMGLMLHANARSLMKNEKYKDALDVLSMAEVSDDGDVLFTMSLANLAVSLVF